MIDAMQHAMSQAIAAKCAILKSLLAERARRLWAAGEACALGRRGISQVTAANRLSRATFRAGVQERDLPVTATGPQTPPERFRRAGVGRKPLGTRDLHLVQALETLVDPVTRGDPRPLLRWTGKSAATLAAALQAQGHAVSEQTVHWTAGIDLLYKPCYPFFYSGGEFARLYPVNPQSNE